MENKKTIVNQVSFSKVSGKLATLHRVLEEAGLTYNDLQVPIDDPKFRERLVSFWLTKGFQPSISQEIARVIMGKNYYGSINWAKDFGVNFTKKQLREIEKFPYNEDILNGPCPFYKGKMVKDTHFAFLGLSQINGDPLSIVKWQEICPAPGQLRFYRYADAWYIREEFVNKSICKYKWYLMPLEIIPDSTSKTFDQQKAMLSAEYEVPSAIEEITKHVLYYKKNGIYLNQTKYGRCQDISSHGHRLNVGYSDPDGLNVYNYSDDYVSDHLGLAASRKEVQS